MSSVEFEAYEICTGGELGRASYRIDGASERGFRIERNGVTHLELGPGYRLLRTEVCGVCSTDLDRHFLPFPLPQIAGHELIARDSRGCRLAPEINATCESLGRAADCAYCSSGLARHCPSRLVLGIHDLPGGFGPQVLVPEGTLVEVPDSVPTETAVLIEPLAAAMRAVERVDLSEMRSVAVLGPKKLGMLVLAALSSERRMRGGDYTITAILRRDALREIALEVGADEVALLDETDGSLSGTTRGSFDLVLDTTGSSAGFDTALRLADKELHLKSTNGQPAGGLRNATALVVDELSIERFDSNRAQGRSLEEGIGWVAGGESPEGRQVVRAKGPLELRERYPSVAGGSILGPELVVVDDLEMADQVIRPSDQDEVPAVRPTGTIAILDGAAGNPTTELERAIVERGMRLSSSRCGDFRTSFQRLDEDPELRRLGELLVTDRMQSGELQAALARAREASALKVLIEHPPATL
ncbi:MAG: alcohol dehydrogenase catalytic domain-containing protein [Planctomycetota bacterium]